jgi:organic radical activating enzyme
MTEQLQQSNYDFTQIPFDKIVSFGQQTLLYKDLFTVSWLLGRFCNYRCSYCWPYARSDRKDHRPIELCLSTIDEIKRQARANAFNSFHFSFSGGEPTFHPGYLDILKYLADDVDNTNYTSVHMTSNCSRNMSWFKEYSAVARLFNRASITASLHTEHVNTPKKMQEFADKLLFCQSQNIQVTINIVMVPNFFDRDWNNALFFHNQNINVTLKPQSNSTASSIVEGYTAEMLEKLQNGMPQRVYTSTEKDQVFQVELTDNLGNKWYMDQAERFNSFGFNRFKGWNCNAGYQGIIIREPDGSIKRSYSCHDEPLGNIETGFNLFKTAMPCITPTCVSSADVKLPKFKVG